MWLRSALRAFALCQVCSPIQTVLLMCVGPKGVQCIAIVKIVPVLIVAK